MKPLFTITVMTTLMLIPAWTGSVYAQEHEHEHDHTGGAGPVVEDGGTTGQMMARCRMTMRAELSPRDPAALLGMKDQLELTDEQVEQLQALAQETRGAATALLTGSQRQQVERLSEQPQSMLQMHQQMMGRMEDVGRMQGMDVCSLMMRMMVEPGEAAATQPAERAELDAEAQTALDQIVASYLIVQQRLAKDEMEGVTAQLTELHDAAHALLRTESPGVQEKAKAVAGTVHDMPENLDEAREVFKSLSTAMIDLVGLVLPGDDAAPALHQAHCPMAKASWLQIGEEIVNPYMGQEMLRCGTIERTIKPQPEG